MEFVIQEIEESELFQWSAEANELKANSLYSLYRLVTLEAIQDEAEDIYVHVVSVQNPLKLDGEDSEQVGVLITFNLLVAVVGKIYKLNNAFHKSFKMKMVDGRLTIRLKGNYIKLMETDGAAYAIYAALHDRSLEEMLHEFRFVNISL